MPRAKRSGDVDRRSDVDPGGSADRQALELQQVEHLPERLGITDAHRVVDGDPLQVAGHP